MNSETLSVKVSKRDCPSPHGLRNKIGRVVWGIVWLCCFRSTPRPCHFWRRGILRLFGARIGKNARIDPSVRIWAPWNLTMGDESSVGYAVHLYCVAPITIGHHATVSQEVMLCTATHSISDPHMRLMTAPIEIADQAWICARAFVSPGIVIGRGAVVGACAVVTKDVPPWEVWVGNPARYLKQRELRTGDLGS